jgi:natural product biosynthesis luciferase-like monooxygenase protein/amino acid adenylation domain-containing protein
LWFPHAKARFLGFSNVQPKEARLNSTAERRQNLAAQDPAVRLREWAAVQPVKVVFTFTGDDDAAEQSITYADLDARARSIATVLRAGSSMGERALLVYPPGLDYVAAIFGCFYSDVIAVPIFPPRGVRSLPRLQSVVEDAQASVILTNSAVLSKVAGFVEGNAIPGNPRWLATDEMPLAAGSDWKESKPSPDAVALLQYTSGSTAAPKGVMITRRNLSHNSEVIRYAFATDPEQQGVFWLPPYHDMGLIGGILQTVYCGASSLLMSPMTFLQNPFRWLEAITRTRASVSGGPNFAYDLCCRKITAEQRQRLDLVSWRVAFNGAEPVRRETLNRFAETFSQCGFRRNAFLPCYGLAESTLLVSGSIHRDNSGTLESDSPASRNGKPRTTTSGELDSMVSCGRVLGEQTIAVINPVTGKPCPENEVGEIWLAGSSVAKGYWRRSEETQAIFGACVAEATGFLRTGDLGLLRNGELFITGRMKDLIILRGRNYYPQDIELAVEHSQQAIRPGCCAAFSINANGEERLAIAAEIERSKLSSDLDRLIAEIRGTIAEQFEISTHSIALLKPGGIPKTTSGKLQRYRCREELNKGTLDVVKAWTINLQEAEVPEQSVPRRLQAIPAAAGVSVTGPTTFAPSVPNATALHDSQERASEIVRWLRDYVSTRLNSQLIDERRCIPPYVVLDFGNRGILGMEVPRSYGGSQLSITDSLRVMEQLAAIDLTLASFVGVNNVLGVRPILHFASQSTRERWLPLLAGGRELAGFAITEPGAGSNPRALQSVAIPTDQGWLLRGQKSWIGNGSWAGVLNVFVKNEAAPDTDSMYGFVVAQGTSGLRMGPEALTMGMRGMVQNSVYLEDVPVAKEDLLGEAGAGFAVAQDAMLHGRLGLAAMSVGGMKRCAQLMHRYASRRTVATGRLLDNSVTLVRLSELTMAITATDLLVRRLAGMLDASKKVPIEAFIICKTSGPEFLWSAADSLVQLLGGRGYTENNVAPQLLRDARLLRIFEGPTEPLSIFLGSCVLHGGNEFHELLCGELGAPAISQALRVAATDIGERHARHRRTSEDLATSRWTSTLVGELAKWALLWAVSSEFAGKNPHDSYQRASDWAEANFNERYSQALCGTAAERVMLDAVGIGDLVTTYEETIGDVEQSLPGVDSELDPLLRRDAGVAERTRSQAETKSRAEEHAETPAAASHSGIHEPVASMGQGSHSFLAELLQNEPEVRERLVTRFLQARLAAAMKVGVELVDVNRSLYNLGMDSLIAVEFKNRIENTFAVRLPITKFLEGGTLAQLATEISSRLGTAPVPVVEPRTHAANAAFEFPLSPGQQALWFIHQLAPDNSAYNVALLLRSQEQLSPHALERALHALIDRHPALRTIFVARNGEPRQIAQIAPEVFFRAEDLSHLAERDFQERCTTEAHRPFDLSAGPLLRTYLFRRGPNSHVLMLVLHHIIEDAWSLGIILNELAELYAAFSSNRETRLSPPAAPYSEYVHWQAEMLSGPEGERLWSYWKHQLGGELPSLDLPVAHRRPPVQTYRGSAHSFQINPQLVKKLRQVAENHATTLHVTLLAAFSALLHRYSWQEEILIGSPMIGRTRPGLTNTVGYFVNPVVLRARLTGDPTFSDLVGRLRGTVLEALEHQDFPFPTLVERLHPERDPSRSPLFDVMFSVQKDLPENLSLISGAPQGTTRAVPFGDLQLDLIAPQQQFAQFDLSLFITESDPALEAALQYNADLFDPATIERMAGHYMTLLDSATGRPEQCVSDLPLLCPRERQTILRLSRNEIASREDIRTASANARSVDFSLFYFAAGGGSFAGKYNLLIEGAKFADQHGFHAVWTPERHFHEFGGIYPNPSVTGAAIAMVTSQVRIRAGSVVLPLHNPVRVAEDWAVVDNLSIGRVDLAFATGWNARDFVLAPHNHTNRKEVMLQGIDLVRRLWRGETVSMPGSAGHVVEVKLFPSPVQPELPFWIACAGNPETFVQAGACGANILTTLLLQPVEALAKNIAQYRRARAASGYDADAGRVTVALHAYVGQSMDQVRATVQIPFTEYLRSSVELWRHESRDLDKLTESERADLLAYSFERYFQTSTLFGTPSTCLEMVERLKQVEVNEIACFIDFGVQPERVLNSLPMLDELRRCSESSSPALSRNEVVSVTTEQTLHGAISARAKEFRDAIAVSFESEQITYSELDRRASQLAHYLRRRGVGPGTLVGLFIERSIEMVVGLLGILKSGAAYVPLDPSYPYSRLQFMVEDSGLHLLVTQQAHAAKASSFAIPSVVLDSERDNIEREPEHDPGVGSAGDLAYVIYTSGSTGRPKGVEVPHSAVLNVLTALSDQIGITDRDVLLAVTTLSFDIAALELFLPLLVGGRVVLASRETASDGMLLQQALERTGTTVMQATPSTWRVLLSSGWQGESRTKILCGGEALSRDLAQRLLDSGSSVWNLYGPTETTIWSTAHELKRGEDCVLIGHAIKNTSTYVLDEKLNLVPQGIPGELYIGGAGLARGYRRRPELNAERFILSPFSPQTERLYRTGDVVRRLRDGTLEFMGRKDSQVKVRGHRVELAEIESRMKTNGEILEAVANVIQNDTEESELVAYYVPRNGGEITTPEWRHFLKEHLPEFMLPSTFVAIPSIPLTDNGKVDRRALPKPAKKTYQSAGYAPGSTLEKTLAGVWKETLRTSEVGTDDNFFDLGGHSLLLAKVQVRLKELLGLDVPMVHLYQYPTVASLARHLEGNGAASLPSRSPASVRREALAQQRLLREERSLSARSGTHR